MAVTWKILKNSGCKSNNREQNTEVRQWTTLEQLNEQRNKY